MKTKLLEIRDIGTKIPVLCVKMEGKTREEVGMLAMAGFPGARNILIVSLTDFHTTYDPFKQPRGRTYFNAHRYIERNWDDLKNGDVVDVEYILGEKNDIKGAEWKAYV